MFSGHFYHGRIMKSVSTFGALFNNIHIIRKNAAGEVISQVKVPLSYGAKRKFLERIREHPDLEEDTQVAIKLPRMSFEITNIAYDSVRQLQNQNTFKQPTDVPTSSNRVYPGVPYIVNFALNIYTKTQDDALQVVEQIIPYFPPAYSVSIIPIPEYPNLSEDVPLTLQSVTFNDDFEGDMENRRTIVYTMEFEMKVGFYGPILETAIINKAIVDFYLQNADSDGHVSRLEVEPTPPGVGPDSDYGFNDTWTHFIE
jgi:hypothetical protein